MENNLFLIILLIMINVFFIIGIHFQNKLLKTLRKINEDEKKFKKKLLKRYN